jgi:hypothetical protein
LLLDSAQLADGFRGCFIVKRVQQAVQPVFQLGEMAEQGLEVGIFGLELFNFPLQRFEDRGGMVVGIGVPFLVLGGGVCRQGGMELQEFCADFRVLFLDQALCFDGTGKLVQACFQFVLPAFTLLDQFFNYPFHPCVLLRPCPFP